MNQINPNIQWHGTMQESNDLVQAVARNCECVFGMMGVRLKTCLPHQMILDQRSVDHLLYARRRRDAWREAEGDAVYGLPEGWPRA